MRQERGKHGWPHPCPSSRSSAEQAQLETEKHRSDLAKLREQTAAAERASAAELEK